jgi:hypothetical protein
LGWGEGRKLRRHAIEGCTQQSVGTRVGKGSRFSVQKKEKGRFTRVAVHPAAEEEIDETATEVPGDVGTIRAQAVEAEVTIEGEAAESAKAKRGDIAVRRCIWNDAPIEVYGPSTERTTRFWMTPETEDPAPWKE